MKCKFKRQKTSLPDLFSSDSFYEEFDRYALSCPHRLYIQADYKLSYTQLIREHNCIGIIKAIILVESDSEEFYECDIDFYKEYESVVEDKLNDYTIIAYVITDPSKDLVMKGSLQYIFTLKQE